MVHDLAVSIRIQSYLPTLPSTTVINMAGKTGTQTAPSVSEIFKTMEYGPAREDDKVAQVRDWPSDGTMDY